MKFFSKRYYWASYILSVIVLIISVFAFYLYNDRYKIEKSDIVSNPLKFQRDQWNFFITSYEKAFTFIASYDFGFKLPDSKGFNHAVQTIVIGMRYVGMAILILFGFVIWFGVCVFISVIHLSALFVYICVFLLSRLLLLLSAILFFLLDLIFYCVFWAINKVFRTDLSSWIIEPSIFLWFLDKAFMILLYSFYLALLFYPIVWLVPKLFWLVHRCVLRPIFILIVILFYDANLLFRRSMGSELRDDNFLSKESEDMADKRYNFKKPEMPELFDPEKIVNQLQKIPKDKALLKAYFSSITHKFRSKIEIRNIEAEMKKLQLGKDYFEIYYETLKSFDKLSDYDTERELEALDAELQKQRKTAEIENLKREGQYKERELKYRMAELEKKERELSRELREDAEDDIQELIKKVMSQSISIIKAKEEIRKTFADNPELIDEMLERFEQELVERGISGGD